MRLYISADIEGVSGVVHHDHTRYDGREYDRARNLMTEEINACIAGAVEAGVTEIVVNDSHGTMRNVILERLHPEAELISGSPKKFAMVEGLTNEFNAAIFLGYHTRMGTNGILNHTFHGGAIQTIKINGIEYGEFGLNAAVAGYHGVPIIMVSGCNLLAEEAKKLIPSITTAVVKQTINRMTARNLGVQKARNLIKNETINAIKKMDNVQPFTFEPSLQVEISFLNSGQADIAEILPIVNRLSPVTVSFTTDSILVAYRYIRSLIAMVH